MTEVSRKYDLQKMTQYMRCFDLGVVHAFTDERRWFGLLLLRRL